MADLTAPCVTRRPRRPLSWLQPGTVGLRGPSGRGKSTLVRVLALLHSPDRSHISLDGTPITGARHRLRRGPHPHRRAARASQPARGDIGFYAAGDGVQAVGGSVHPLNERADVGRNPGHRRVGDGDGVVRRVEHRRTEIVEFGPDLLSFDSSSDSRAWLVADRCVGVGPCGCYGLPVVMARTRTPGGVLAGVSQRVA
jgi:energy-coupling factor transporter ATP-binding protein EcfA2